MIIVDAGTGKGGMSNGIAGPTMKCNLRCKGCYTLGYGMKHEPPELSDRILKEYEDGYLDIRLGIEACDPWAVHSATRFRGSSCLEGTEGLTDLQKAIYEPVKRKGNVTREEVRESLSLPIS